MDIQSRLATTFAELAHLLQVPWEWVASTGLLALATAGHLLLVIVLHHLAKVARRTRREWDDAILSALGPPAKFAWWLLLFAMLFALLPSLASLRDMGLRVIQGLLVLLVPWFLHRLIASIEEQIVRERLADGSSIDKATVRSTARLLRVALWSVAVLMLLQTLGVSVSGLLAFRRYRWHCGGLCCERPAGEFLRRSGCVHGSAVYHRRLGALPRPQH